MTDILERFESIVAGRPAPRVIELGANNGYHTDLLASRTPIAGRLYALEPDPRVFPQLEARTLRHLHVRRFLLAAGDVDGETTLNLSGGHETRPGRMAQSFTGSSSLMRPAGVLDEYPDMRFETTTAKVCRLDTFCEQHGIGDIDFIWSDIQGAELRMIAGARKALARTRYLYTEFNDRSMYEGDATLSKIVETLGWDVVEVYESDALLRNPQC